MNPQPEFAALNGPLSCSSIEEIRRRVLAFLGDRGIEIQHRGALNLLAGAGARVDFDSGLVRMPESLVEEALARAPREFLLAAQRPEDDRPLPPRGRGFLLCTGTGARGLVDPERGVRRDLTLADARAWGGLVGVLENIDLCAFPTPTDAPPRTVDVHSLRALLVSCPKHIWIQPHTAETLPFLLELTAARAGGRRALAARPLASIIACALTPFRVKSMDVEVIVQAGRYGLPLHLSSLPVIGGTSPATVAGTVAVAAIEVAALAVLAQVAHPGLPVVALATSLGMDMRSGRAVKSAPEAMLANAASAQFLRAAFGLPVHTAGLTSDMAAPGGQAAVEHSLFSWRVLSSGADILGRAGELEAARTWSPLQLIIDDEVAGMLKVLCSRVESDEDSLAWDDILAVPPGGQFLDREHTLRHCRDAFQPRLFLRQAREDWESAGRPDLLERARSLYAELGRRFRADAAAGLPDHTREEMERIVREADRALEAGR